MSFLDAAHPWVLALAVPVWAALGAAAFRNRPARPGAVGRFALSVLATGCLLAGLAAPSIRTTRRAAAHVAIAADVSASMALAGAPPPETLRVSLARALPDVPLDLVPFSPGDRTDLAAGLADAAAALPEGRGLVLLVGDGRGAVEEAVAEATRLASRGVAVHTLMPRLTVPADVRVTGVAPLAPPEAGQPVALELRLAANVDAEAEIILRHEGADRPPETRSVRLEAGSGASLRFDAPPPPEGIVRYAAEVASPADTVAENNRATLALLVGPPRRFVYLHGGPEPGAVRDLLPRPVTTMSDEAGLAVPSDAAVVVLDDVPAPPAAEVRRLAARVTEGGLGLVVLGGERSFAAGGYAASPLDDLLPVTSRAGKRPPVALVLALDTSGSMNETVGGVQKLALAKQAVLELRPALAEGDRPGLVAFADQPDVVTAPAPLEAWPALRGALLAVRAAGGTRITPAVRTALGLLEPSSANATRRHVLLLSDGQSEDFDVAALLAACREAGVTVSTVATGADADLARLAALAEGTGGRFYRTRDLARLGATFLRDLAAVRGEGLKEGPLQPRRHTAPPLWDAPAGPLPPVAAWNPTRMRPEATLHWAATHEDRDVPLLASWRRGLGAVAAMPWPAGEAPDGLAAHLPAILAWLRGPADPGPWEARIEERGGRWVVRAEVPPEGIPEAGEFTATAFPEGRAEARAASLEQVEPGIFEADLGPASGSAAAVVVAGKPGGGRVRLARPGLPPAEYEAFGADLDALERIAEAGGGRLHTSPAAVADAVREHIDRAMRPVGLWFLRAGLGAIVLLVGLRLAGRL